MNLEIDFDKGYKYCVNCKKYKKDDCLYCVELPPSEFDAKTPEEKRKGLKKV